MLHPRYFSWAVAIDDKVVNHGLPDDNLIPSRTKKASCKHYSEINNSPL